MAFDPDRVSFSSGGGVNTIQFDTCTYAPGEELVDFVKKEIADLASQGIEIKLKAERLGEGILVLILRQADSVGNKFINLIKRIINRIEASVAPITPTASTI